MRMSDWSSDVCSSDLRAGGAVAVAEHEGGAAGAAVRPAVGRHRMAVDQDAVAEALLGLRHQAAQRLVVGPVRSEEHTSELQSLMRISYAVFCLKKKKKQQKYKRANQNTQQNTS